MVCSTMFVLRNFSTVALFRSVHAKSVARTVLASCGSISFFSSVEITIDCSCRRLATYANFELCLLHVVQFRFSCRSKLRSIAAVEGSQHMPISLLSCHRNFPFSLFRKVENFFIQTSPNLTKPHQWLVDSLDLL